MAWVYLIAAGVFEWGWPIGLKLGWTAEGAQPLPLTGAQDHRLHAGPSPLSLGGRLSSHMSTRQFNYGSNAVERLYCSLGIMTRCPQ